MYILDPIIISLSDKNIMLKILMDCRTLNSNKDDSVINCQKSEN